ncbi:hypothetical protein [Sinorhizobium medicae]|uniref:Uncharacterized protein n=1 Tax=Sinorhizobium medicae TaxID=110321 RepID=A0A508X6I5_9HYPH|nr:hypothetical protein [Sinorhizobium medicae]VTZ65465.1 conserved hypothetical protein [Sinorhizobium medicae]
MSERLLLLYGPSPDHANLREALAERHIRCVSIKTQPVQTDVEQLTATFASHGSFGGLALLPFAGSFDDTSEDRSFDISDRLGDAFAGIKAALSLHERNGVPGRLISILPAEAAMGDPNDIVGSSLAGAMLSLFRTTALELKGTSSSANTLMYHRSTSGRIGEPQALAAMIDTLLDAGSAAVNGQEIFAAGAADVGRLRP